MNFFGGRHEPQVADFIQEGLVTDFKNLRGLRPVPGGFTQDIADDFFLYPVYGLFLYLPKGQIFKDNPFKTYLK